MFRPVSFGVPSGWPMPASSVIARFDDLKAHLGARHLAAAELEAQLHLVAVIEKLLGVTQLRDEIVLFDPDAELDLLDLARRRLDVGVLFRLLVHVLAEIHDPADRRRDVRRDFDQVELELLRQLQRLAVGRTPSCFPSGLITRI